MLDLHGELDSDAKRPRQNTYAGWPASAGFGLYLEVSLVVSGHPDTRSGYLEDIGAIDDAVRRIVLAQAHSLIGRPSGTGSSAPPTAASVTPAHLLRTLLSDAPPLLGRGVDEVRLSLTPFLSMTMSTTSADRVTLTQRFEFSASHRLHCRDLSDERNRQLFGKCNNPNGHGHNYRLDVAVDGRVDDTGVARPDLHQMEAVVRREVIDRLDHRHLNLDVPQFAELNPSVENIARVVHSLLASPIDAVGGTLRAVTVWETEKTCCTYPASGISLGA